MALTAVVGALRVVLGADTAAFESGFKSAEKTLTKFSGSITKIGVGLGAALTGATAAVAAGMKGALNQAEQLNKMSQVLGISTEELSVLKHAAELADVSFESLAKGMSRLNRNIADVAGGAQGPAAEAFKALQISVKNTDSSLKSASQISEEISNKFVTMQDGAGKAGLAMRLMGKSGSELIPFLNLGGAELKKMKEEAEALGIVIDQRTAKAADNFNDNLSKLNKGIQGIFLRVSAELAPAMAVLLERFVEWLKTTNIVTSTAGFIVQAFASIELAVRNTVVVFRNAGGEIAAFGRLVAAALTFNVVGMVQAFQELRVRGAETDRQFAENRQIYEDFTGRISRMREEFDRLTDGPLKKTPAAIAQSKNALDGFIKSQEKAIATQLAEATAMGKGVGERERLRVLFQAETIAKEEQIKINERMAAQLDALGQKAADTALKLNASKLVEESVPAWQKYQQQVADAQKGLALLGADAATTERTLTQLAVNSGQAWNIALGQITGDFASAFKEFAKNNKSLGVLAKGFAIAQAIINTYTAATKALAIYGPTPLGYAAMAAAIATGFAQVANIKAQKFATGGMMRMNDAARGPDSQLMVARVRPDEQIDIWRPGEGPDPRGRGGGGAREIIIRVDEISRATVEKLIPALNSAIGDGHVLKMGTT